MAQMVKNLPAMQETWVWSQNQDPLEKGMATHSSILAWRIPWTEKPGRLQCMGSKELEMTERLSLFRIENCLFMDCRKRRLKSVELRCVAGSDWFKMPASGGYSWSPRGGWDCQGESPCWKAKRGAKDGALRNTSIWSPEEEKELSGKDSSGHRRMLCVVEASVLCNTFPVNTHMFADGLIVSPHEPGTIMSFGS